MRRLRLLALLQLSCVLVFIGGCTRSQSEPEAAPVTLELTFPESIEPPQHAPERASKLTIDGKDFSEPRANRRSVSAQAAAGKDEVTVESSFWPNSYTNIIRKRVVPITPGKAAQVDMTQEDLKFPDMIKPIYYPTPHEVVEEMCKLAKVGPEDVVHDIGCGDGRLVILAVKKFGAKKGVGIDIEEHLVQESWKNAKKEGVGDRVEFRVGDALKIKDFSDASVVLLYVGGDLNLKLRPILQKTLKPGSRVVSHRFTMGDWQPDETRKVTAKNNNNLLNDYELHLWTIK